MGESYTFTVNGILRETEEEKPLLRYLRDDLHLTSVKDGCSEGACGTCTIVVDGKAVRSCILTTKKAVGKHILTVEGLTEAEQETFVYAFGAVGAVQCGFCIPGMVLSGKALLDQNPVPSEDEIKKAIRGNVCRCTGYKKIIEGISLAGAILRGERTVDPCPGAGRTLRGGGAGLPLRCAGQGAGPGRILRRCGPPGHGPRLGRPLGVPQGTCAGHRRLGRPGPPRRAGGAYRRGCTS